MQTIMNNMENDGDESKSVATDSDRDNVHSNWSELMPINEEVEYSKLKCGMNVNASTSNGEPVKTMLAQPRKRAVKNLS